VPVGRLVITLRCAFQRLSPDKLKSFVARVAMPEKHQAALAEMLPMLRVAPNVPAIFEVSGLGVGNQTVDWAIGPLDDRTVLLEVKRRIADLIKQMDRVAIDRGGGKEPILPPDHDPLILFRGVEKKFRPTDPEKTLQGAWIVSDLKQEATELEAAFRSLDQRKVHFAILGGWDGEVYTLVRRSEDKQFLLDIFNLKSSERFVWNRD
jgi:hypothetical protein